MEKNLDWDNLGFSYRPVKSHIRYTYKDGKWSEGKLLTNPNITLSIAATCLHYGQACFEGLKAFRTVDDEVKVFRMEENAIRMNRTIDYMLGPQLPEGIFIDAVKKVIKDNIDYVPPYSSGGSLYVRPFFIGSGAQIGIAPSQEYEFIVLVTPVGPYYQGGMKPVNALIIEDYDRAAPKGSGSVKIAGNYAASLKPNSYCQEKGFPIALYLDAKTRTCIEEFGTSNFIGITKDNQYITPDSPSILKSITNASLMQLAKDNDMQVEQRPVPVTELDQFTEVGACGTAVVITPIGNIVYGDKTYSYTNECTPVLKQLYNWVQGIQYGKIEDKHDWMTKI